MRFLKNISIKNKSRKIVLVRFGMSVTYQRLRLLSESFDVFITFLKQRCWGLEFL